MSVPDVDPSMREHIAACLARVEREEGVRVLYAAEAGSRALGLASPGSDFDVRFIYVHPRTWYLGLAEERDVVERPLDEQRIDLAGWDVRKALRLLLRSNPGLYEWLVSPIVYRDDGRFRDHAEALFAAHASAATLAHHYYSTASDIFRRYVAGRDLVLMKRYVYVVRPVLALRWVANHGTLPPMAIGELLATCDMPRDTRGAVDNVLELKRAWPDLGFGPRFAEIDRWVEKELRDLDPARLGLGDTPRVPHTRAAADELFRATAGL